MSTTVKRHFARISRRYDRINDLLSWGQDRHWRQQAIDLLPLSDGTLLDLACGTGRCGALALARRRAGRVIGVDFCPDMLRAGHPPAGLVRCGGDAERLPLRDGCCDACCLAWGWRNLPHPARGLAAIHRVLRPGGRLLIIDFFRPTRWWPRCFQATYGRFVIPLIGGLVSGSLRAYRHLPHSIAAFMDPTSATDLLISEGFAATRWLALSGGIGHAVLAVRAGSNQDNVTPITGASTRSRSGSGIGLVAG